jgi:hypothetical protein
VARLDQRPHRDRLSRSPAQGAGQFRRLVVAPAPKPRAVQRHGHDQLAVFDQALARPRQPLRKTRHQLQPVGMLERQDGAPARFVIGDDGAGAVEGWRLGHASGAARARAGIDAEG